MCEKRLSIREEQDEFIRDFNELEDWMVQYDCLLGLTKEMAPVAPEQKTTENLIAGCQAKLWVVLSFRDGKIRVNADSESLIVKGIVAVIAALFDNRTPEEICHATVDFMERTPLKQQISVDRFQGMQKVISRIKKYAERFCGQPDRGDSISPVRRTSGDAAKPHHLISPGCAS